MGNTCKPMAVSFQCMTKSTTNKKNKLKKNHLVHLHWFFFFQRLLGHLKNSPFPSVTRNFFLVKASPAPYALSSNESNRRSHLSSSRIALNHTGLDQMQQRHYFPSLSLCVLQLMSDLFLLVFLSLIFPPHLLDLTPHCLPHACVISLLGSFLTHLSPLPLFFQNPSTQPQLKPNSEKGV